MSIFEYSGRKEIITRRKTFDDRFEALFFFFSSFAVKAYLFKNGKKWGKKCSGW